jgi:RNA polymerase sigma-70 factor, ECF subfamily
MDDLSQELLKEAAAGDMVAFEKLYRVYSPFVYNVALRMVEAKEDAEEVTQEVFLTLHKKLNTFLFKSSLKTWIYRITVNCSINLLNQRNKRQKGRVDIDDTLLYAAGPDEFGVRIDKEDNERKVRALLDVLNPDERACIVLRNIEGLSYAGVAQALNVNINTVRTRLKRGLAKMLKMATEVKANE